MLESISSSVGGEGKRRGERAGREGRRREGGMCGQAIQRGGREERTEGEISARRRVDQKERGEAREGEGREAGLEDSCQAAVKARQWWKEGGGPPPKGRGPNARGRRGRE